LVEVAEGIDAAVDGLAKGGRAVVVWWKAMAGQRHGGLVETDGRERRMLQKRFSFFSRR
jgi:hypothetical protein